MELLPPIDRALKNKLFISEGCWNAAVMNDTSFSVSDAQRLGFPSSLLVPGLACGVDGDRRTLKAPAGGRVSRSALPTPWRAWHHIQYDDHPDGSAVEI